MTVAASQPARAEHRPDKHKSADRPVIAVVGNPNTGKTTLFNALTGLHQHTGNYPGVTVEKKVGLMRIDGAAGDGSAARHAELIDLPGAYSLAARSPDEMVAADVLLGQQAGARLPDAVLVVLDAANLERNLFLASQVIECGRPTVIALNMIDLAEARGIRIDPQALAAGLGCRVVAVVATRGRGLAELRAALAAALADPPSADAPRTCPMPDAVESAVAALADFFAARADRLARPVHRVEALRVLIDRGGQAERRMAGLLGGELADRLAGLRADLAAADVELVVAEPEARYEWIGRVVGSAMKRTKSAAGRRRSDRLDAILTHPVAGTAVFVIVMALVFQSIFAWAAPAMELIDSGLKSLGDWAGALLPAGALRSLLVDGVIAGVGAVLVFLPQIVILFGFIAFLEDCGYMARAAFLMDRLLSRCGLSGRSFVPMLSSFACAVPGIMAARVIENRRDRITTILVSPLMSCSARLPVYALLIAAFIPSRRWLGGLVNVQGLTLFALYALGVIVAVPVAWLLKRTLLRGDTPPFVMEMPSFKWPSPRVIAMRMLDRGRAFVVRAGTIIFAVTLIVWALSYYPRPASIGARYDEARAQARTALNGQPLDEQLARLDNEEAGEYLRQSALGRAGRLIEPAVEPLGWDWQIGMATLASFPAREVVISTLGTIYNLGGGQDEASAELRDTLRAQRRADGSAAFTPLVAVSLMVFFALCCQCAATLAVMRRETASWRWPLFAFGYMTALAYVAAWAVFQAGSALGFG